MNLKTVGIFSAGLLTGSVVVGAGLYVWFRRQFDKELEAERDILRRRTERLREKAEERRERASTSDSKAPQSDSKPVPVSQHDPLVEATREAQKAPREDYYGISMKKLGYETIADDDEETRRMTKAQLERAREQRLAESESPSEDYEQELEDEAALAEYEHEEQEKLREQARHRGIFTITDQQYIENPWDYNQISLTYYHGDNTLTDDMDEPISIADTIGRVTIDMIDLDENVVYICHPQKECLYEIIIMQGSYHDEYDEPQERPGSRKGPRGEWR